MPSYVLKVDRENDLYVAWSTIVDNACRAGTRTEMLETLRREEPHGYTANPGNAPEDRLRRADETGTSALWPSAHDPFGGWYDEYLMVEQSGLLPRERLGAYLDAHFEGDREKAEALLRHFDDCECAECVTSRKSQ